MFPIETDPICGVNIVSDLLGIKPKPDLPITVLGWITTCSEICEHSIKTPDPIKVFFPILQFLDIVTLSEIYTPSSIVTPSSIKEKGPILTFLPIIDFLSIIALGWILWLSACKSYLLK